MKKTLTILVADDDATHREVLRTLLEEWGYAVREAVDGEHAVALCREQPFDLVLMDVRMPKKSGLEALKEIKVHNPAVPVLIMTAFSEVAAAVEAIKSGAYDYLTKPLDFEKLKVVLRNVFAHVGLIRENATLSRSLAATEAQTGMVGRSESMRALWEMVRTIAPTDATVLITGESGTGKELVAKAVHAASRRARGPFVAVNCAALTESLLASELFGHEKGAFTGADKKHEGHFLKADGGTIFLDEIGEMPLSMQVKLLRVIQEREVLSVGGNKAVPVDVRIIAATNRDLAKEVAAGTFRQDERGHPGPAAPARTRGRYSSARPAFHGPFCGQEQQEDQGVHAGSHGPPGALCLAGQCAGTGKRHRAGVHPAAGRAYQRAGAAGALRRVPGRCPDGRPDHGLPHPGRR